MKKFIYLTVFAFCFAFTSQAQEKANYLDDGTFFTAMNNGSSIKVPIKLYILDDDINLILSSNAFKEWKEDLYSDSRNKGYIERWKNQEDIETYLMSIMYTADFAVKSKLKNENSFIPLNQEEGVGSIYVLDNLLYISIPFKAQNEYGNFIMSKAILEYSLDIHPSNAKCTIL